MIGAARRFSELMIDLLLQREIAGGPLSQEDEAAAAAELERCWWGINAEEQVELERIYSAKYFPSAPTRTNLLDVVLEKGARSPPRITI